MGKNIRQVLREFAQLMKSDWYLPVTEHQVYDLTERVIGTYMGKPLYRKTVDCGELTNGTAKTIAHNISDIEKIVRLYGEVRRSDGLTLSIPNAGIGNSATYQIRVEAAGQDVVINPAGDYRAFTATVTLEYTKTTDTVQSSKVPYESLTEYSTEERMIGYWIDGKPLYRKVVVIPTNGVSEKKSVAHGIQNIYRTIHAYGYWFAGGSNNFSLTLPRSSNVELNANIDLTVDAVNVNILNLPGSASEAAAIIEYTKTTD